MTVFRTQLASIKEPAFDLTNIDKFITCGIAYLHITFSFKPDKIITQSGDYETEAYRVLMMLVEVRGRLSNFEGTNRQFNGLLELDKLIGVLVRRVSYTVPREWRQRLSN